MKCQVFGPARSGTTLLASIIDEHPKASCLIEPYLRYQKNSKFPNTCSEVERSTIEMEPRLFLDEVENYYEIASLKETYRIEDHDVSNKNIILDNLSYFQKNIVIIRDIRDIWISVLTRGNKSKQKGLELYQDEKTYFAKNWNDLCRLVRNSNLFFIKYEDLVKHPNKNIQKIYQYLELDEFKFEILSPISGSGDEKAQKGGEIFDTSVGRWKDEISEKMSEFFIQKCRNNLEYFEYI